MIVISADNDELEGAKKEEQMPEHTRLVSALMIRQLSVLVAKMDCNGWDENSSNKIYQRNRNTLFFSLNGPDIQRQCTSPSFSPPAM